MKSGYIWANITLLIVATVLYTSCTASEPPETIVEHPKQEQTDTTTPSDATSKPVTESGISPDVDEQPPTEYSDTLLDIKASISDWFPENADSVSQVIAELVPIHLSVFRGTIADILKTIIMTELELKVEQIELIDDDDKYSAKVALGFPILLEVPLVISKEYWMDVVFDVVVDDGRIVDVSIDVASFNMESIEPDEEHTDEPVTMEILPLEKVGTSYRYRTVLENRSGVEVQITALTREFIETGYSWTGGRDYLIDHVGSFTIPANGKLEWETAFDLSEVTDYFGEHGKVTYREGWYGIDASGNPIGLVFSISTDDF